MNHVTLKNVQDTFTLSNGVQIPCMGLGTWQTDGDTTVAAIKAALNAGYRLIDTAAAYGNEASVGRAISECGLKREDVFITSKLRNACHGYKATKEAFALTLERLGTDYLDLYLIHWPNPMQYRTVWQEATIGTWKAFEEEYKAGRIRAIGVSNFFPHHIEMLRKNCEIMPMVNQLKLCPGVTQADTVAYCKANNILVEAYSPFGTGMIFQCPEMVAIAEKYGKSVGQICLRWSLQMGWLPLPKSGNPARIAENTQVFDFELDIGDMDRIAALKGVCGEAPDSDNITF